MKPEPRKTIDIWLGMSFSAWIRMLIRYRCRIDPGRLPAVMIISLCTALSSLGGLLERVVFARRIRAQRIDPPPVFILGHWRSGTTMLHEIMAADPRHAAPSTYQCFCPCNFLLTERLLKPLLAGLVPDTRPQDNMPIDFDSPQEDECGLNALGAVSTYWNIAFPATRREPDASLEVEQLPPRHRVRWERALYSFLQRVSVAHPGQRLIVKSPPHTMRIPTLLRLFPDARFIHIARNPIRVFQSSVNLWQSSSDQYSLQNAPFRDVDDYVLDLYERMYDVYLRDRQLIPADRLYELRYEDLLDDPLGKTEAIYRHLDLEPFEIARPHLEQYGRARSGYKTNRYQMDPERLARVRARLRSYCTRFGYDADSDEG